MNEYYMDINKLYLPKVFIVLIIISYYAMLYVDYRIISKYPTR